MITKKTFMTIVNALDFGICKCRQFCEVNNLSLEETNECKIQPEDCVVSYPIYQGETTTVDSLVVFTPEHRLKMLVLNDFVNRGTEIATTSAH